RLMRIRRDDRMVTITNGTLYHTVGRLERAGLVAEVGVDREGNRPERTTYAVTDAGTRAVSEWVRRELVRVDRPAEFRIALAEAHNLERTEVVDLLRTRREDLAGLCTQHEDGLRGALAKGVPEQYLLELDRERTLLRSDLAWLDHTIDRIIGDALPWGAHEPTER